MIFEESPDETPGTQKAVAQAGLLPLTGSAEAIAQAEAIRAQTLVDADNIITRMRSEEVLTDTDSTIVHPTTAPVTHEQVLATQAALNRLRHQTEADWWLQNGSRGAGALLNAFMA